MLSTGELRQTTSLVDLTLKSGDPDRSGSDLLHYGKLDSQSRAHSSSASNLQPNLGANLELLASKISQDEINKRRQKMEQQFKGYGRDQHFLTPPARFEGARRYAPSYINSSASDVDYGIIISSTQSSNSVTPPPRIYGPPSGRTSGRVSPKPSVEFYTGYVPHAHRRQSSYETSVYNPTSYRPMLEEYHGTIPVNKRISTQHLAKSPLAKYGSAPILDNLQSLAESFDGKLRRHSTSNNDSGGLSSFLDTNARLNSEDWQDHSTVNRDAAYDQDHPPDRQTVISEHRERNGESQKLSDGASPTTSGYVTPNNEGSTLPVIAVTSPNMSQADVKEKLNNIFSRQLGVNTPPRAPSSTGAPYQPVPGHHQQVNENPVRKRKPPVPIPHQNSSGHNTQGHNLYHPDLNSHNGQGVQTYPQVSSGHNIQGQNLPHADLNSHNGQGIPIYPQVSSGHNIQGQNLPHADLNSHSGQGIPIYPQVSGGHNIQGQNLHHPDLNSHNGQGIPTYTQVSSGHNIQEQNFPVSAPHSDINLQNGQGYRPGVPVYPQVSNGYNIQGPNASASVPPPVLNSHNVQGYHPGVPMNPQFSNGYNIQGYQPSVPPPQYHNFEGPNPAGHNIGSFTNHSTAPGYMPHYMPGHVGNVPSEQTVNARLSVSNHPPPNIPVPDVRPQQHIVINTKPEIFNDVSKVVPDIASTKEKKSSNLNDGTSDDPEPDYAESESGMSYDMYSGTNGKDNDDKDDISMTKTNDDNIELDEEDLTWRPYDIFTVSEREADDDNKVFKEILKAIRGSLYIIIVAIMLIGTVSSRVALYLLASDINQVKTRASGESVVLLMFCICGPMVYNWLNAFMKILFGGKEWPSIKTFAVMLFFELLTTFGLCLLVFKILPSVDFFRGITITLAMFQIPAICQVMMLDRKLKLNFKTILKMVTSVIAMLLQIGALVYFILMGFIESSNPVTVLHSQSKEVKPLNILYHESVWELPVALVLISFGWWENYVSSDWSVFGRVHIGFKHWRHILQETRETSSFLIGPFKIALVVILGKYLADVDFALPTMSKETNESDFHGKSYSLVYITLGSAILCTYLSGLACKLHMQKTAFALPLVLSPPASLVLLYFQCRYEFLPRDWHSGSWFCPNYEIENLIEPIAVAGTLWLSYCIIVSHIWFPKSERMAKIEKIFLTPHFNAIFPDFNLTLRRRRNDQELRATRFEHFTYVGDDAGDHLTPEGVAVEENTVTPTIFVCATMWHETQREMTQLLKSLFRLDYSHCASKLAQAKFNIRDPDYFDMEIHIIFDDAFDIDLENNKFVPNSFVTQFISCMEDAARSVVKGFIIIPSPVKVVTPYGGRLIWTMPGQTQMVVHLKDKNKIRHRKRWSQVMYLYYLLGFRLLGGGDGSEIKEDEKTQPNSSNVRNRKKIRRDKKRKKSNMPLKNLLMRVPPENYEQIVETSENTFLLTLDGDVDFRPDSVKLLIDRMKKNKKVGAVCGRIHPIGSGPMVWYQQFEYAVGHWLQKAAEHVFGCVLCCPGCFSLFRGSAVMDDNVLKMYTTKPTEARHFIQFEQGEDRWLCTLLLQQGHRIDYSAGADALTYAPETFNEFFNQRRRWSPSTLANMMDLLASWRETVRLNDNISRIYVLYQFTLMASSILAPSTVVLMITSSYNTVIGLSNWWSYILSVLPVAIYTAVCLTTKTNTQIKVGAVLTAIYTVVMMIATVGTIISIATENFSSPNVVFITGLGVIFITAAVLHPQEIYCLVYGALYFLVVPSTFILLTIFYLCNLNNVSWGTREVPKKMTPEEEEAIKKAEEERKKKKKSWNIFTTIGLMNIVNELREVIRSVWGLRHDLQQQGQHEQQAQEVRQQELPKPNNVEAAKPKKVKKEITGYEPDPENPFWIHLEDMGHGPVEVLENSEEEFWKFLIKKYLHPIEENKEQKEKIAADLLEVRNNVVFIYIMLNFLWTVIALQLQTSEDTLKDYYIVRKYEPMSLLFLVIFASVMVIQFIGMIMHRWGTFLHLMSSTRIDWFSGSHSEDDFARFVVQEIQKHQNLEPSPDYGDDDEDELTSLPTDIGSAPDYDMDEDVVSGHGSVRSSYNNQMVWPRNWNQRPSHPGHFPRLENILDHKLGRLQQQLSHVGRSTRGNNNLMSRQLSRPHTRGFNGWSHRDATMRQKFLQQNFQQPNQEGLSRVRVI